INATNISEHARGNEARDIPAVVHRTGHRHVVAKAVRRVATQDILAAETRKLVERDVRTVTGDTLGVRAEDDRTRASSDANEALSVDAVAPELIGSTGERRD